MVLSTTEECIEIPTQVSLMYQGQPTHNYHAILQTLLAGLNYGRYLERKYDLQNVWEWINWVSFWRAMSSYDKRSLALLKYLHGWLATSENLQKRGPFEIW